MRLPAPPLIDGDENGLDCVPVPIVGGGAAAYPHHSGHPCIVFSYMGPSAMHGGGVIAEVMIAFAGHSCMDAGRHALQ